MSTTDPTPSPTTRRLEQLRYEAKGEARIRPVNPNGAMVPGRPISDKRLTWLLPTPFVMLGLASCLFLVVEASSGPKEEAVAVKPPAEA